MWTVGEWWEGKGRGVDGRRSGGKGRGVDVVVRGGWKGEGVDGRRVVGKGRGCRR